MEEPGCFIPIHLQNLPLQKPNDIGIYVSLSNIKTHISLNKY